MAVPTGSQVVGVANTLLGHAGLRRTVHGIEQCGSVLFAQLYEALTGSRPPREGESEAERCQAVVDAFSELLSPHISLDHIRGRELAARDPLTIINLLDIISVLFHSSQPGPATTEREDTSNFLSEEGFGILSEVLQEELCSAHGHTHFSSSYSTDSTAELLRPVPRDRLPHPHLSHPHPTPPSLTITSLTCSTDDQSQDTIPVEGTTSNIETEVPTVASNDPLASVETAMVPPLPSTPPPCTPPPSQRQLLDSPLHHSTPRTLATRARLFAGRAPSGHTPPPRSSVTSHPLTKATLPDPLPTVTLPSSPPHPLPTVTLPYSPPHPLPTVTLPSSPPHPLPTVTHPSPPHTLPGSSELGGEEEGTPPHTTTQTTQDVENSILVPEPEHGNATASQDQHTTSFETKSSSRKPVCRVPAATVEGEKTEAVREKVLVSLYQRYLRELRGSGPPLAQRKKHKPPRAVSRHCKPHGKKTATKIPPRPLQTHRHKAEGGREEEGEGEEEEGEDHKKTELPHVTTNLFPVVEASLPVCPVATETVRHLWGKQLRQITTFTKPTPSHPPRIDQEMAEVKRKHTALFEAIQKEIDHTRRLHGQQETRAQQRAVKAQLKAKRQATVRARRYFRDYELNLKSKLQKKRTSEEQVFRRVFEDGLAILRERERELRRFDREKRDTHREKQRQQLQALEQYYSDQFSMLSESLVRQREKAAVKDKAQNQLAEQLRRELRERLEREVKRLQECLDRDEDVTHFRELDAQQLRLALHHLLTPVN